MQQISVENETCELHDTYELLEMLRLYEINEFYIQQSKVRPKLRKKFFDNGKSIYEQHRQYLTLNKFYLLICLAGNSRFKVNNRNTRTNMFKVNNKDTRATPLVTFWCLYY